MLKKFRVPATTTAFALLLCLTGCVSTDEPTVEPPTEPPKADPYAGLACDGPDLPAYSRIAGGRHTGVVISQFNAVFERTDGRSFLHTAMAGDEVYIGEPPFYPHVYQSPLATSKMLDAVFASSPPDVEAILGCGSKNPEDSLRDDLDKCGRLFVPAFDLKLKGIETSASGDSFNPEFEAYYQTFTQADSRRDAFFEVAKAMFLKNRYAPSTFAISSELNEISILNPFDVMTFMHVSLFGRPADEAAFLENQITPPVLGEGAYNYDSTLATPAGRAEFADSRIGSAEHRRHLPSIVRDWLGLPYRYANQSSLTPLDLAMDEEIDLFLAELFTGNYTLTDLFTANFTYVNAELAVEYGIAGVEGEEFVRVPLAAGDEGIMNRLGAAGLSDQIIDTLLCDSFAGGVVISSQADLVEYSSTQEGQKALASCFFEKYVLSIRNMFAPNACEVADNISTWNSEGKTLKQLLRAPFLQDYFNQSLVF